MSNHSHEKKLFNKPGNILISDQFNNRVIEITPTGRIVWSFGLGPTNFTQNSVIGVNDAQRVGDLTLMAGTGTPPGVIPEAPSGAVDNRVLLVNKHKKIIWSYGQFGLTGSGFNLLNVPVQCTYVPRKECKKDKDCKKDKKHNKHHSESDSDSESDSHDKCDAFDGTILITDQGNNRIIRVNHKKRIVWQYPGPNTNPNDQLNSPNSAEMLENGHVLIADENNNRAIEVTKHHKVVRVYTAHSALGACAFASRLPNRHTLLTDAGNSRIIEVNEDDYIVWQYITNAQYNSISAPLPTRGLRLKHGNTIISDQFNNRVIIINGTTIVAYYGLPLDGGSSIGNNSGYDTRTTQLGLYSPYDAKVIGDYNGITKP